MALVEGKEYPEHLYYDLDNQVWYEALDDGTVRAGFHAARHRSRRRCAGVHAQAHRQGFRGAALLRHHRMRQVGRRRAGRFNGSVVAANAELERRPRLLNEDAFGAGWMLIVRPADTSWRDRLMTGAAIGPAFAAWIAAEAYKDRAG